MKQNILTFILMTSALWTSHRVLAYDFEVDGICYTVTSFENFTVKVDGFKSSLSGIVELPSTITYNSKTFSVTCIASARGANIETVKIPTSITNIEIDAFSYTSIKYLDIPDNIVSIGAAAFENCYNLESIRISKNVLDLSISLFKDCTNLKKVEWHPSKSSRIEYNSFENCSSLKSFTIPSTCNIIGDNNIYDDYHAIAFKNCSSLDTLIIEDGTETLMFNHYKVGDEKYYGEFHGCPIKYIYLGRRYDSEKNGLRKPIYPMFSPDDLIIGDGVQSLLTWPTIKKTIVVGKSLKEIEGNSSQGLDYIKIRQGTPPKASSFSNYIYINTILYVPKGSKSVYESANIWKNFFNIQEFDFEDVEIEVKKCANPTIYYNNGNLSFVCETEDAICQASISDTDIKTYSGNEIRLGVTYVIDVYATKAGYENSETVTATLCWIDQQPTTEGISNDIFQIPARAVLIQSQGGILTIQGIDEGSYISIYTISGQMVGSTRANGNQATLSTNFKKGEVAVIKIGEKSVKVVMQ